MVVICLVAICIMIFSLSKSSNDVATFTQPPFEQSAIQGVPDVSADLGYSELDAQDFKVSICGNLTLIGNEVDIYLTNPESNNVWLKVRMLDDQQNIIGETGLIKPNEYVKSISLDVIPQNSTNVSLKIMSYQPDTYYSAGVVSLNTTLNVS